MFDISKVRADFPLLTHHPDLVFLDTAASAQKPQYVLDKMQQFQSHSYANIHRGVYQLSATATQMYEDARATIAQFFGAESPQNIVFTKNATEAINLVAHSWARQHLQAGDTVLLSALEHHANIVPWQLLRDKIGIKIKVLPLDNTQTIRADVLQQHWEEGIELVALSQLSNVLGTWAELAEIIPFVRKSGAKILIDGSQGAVHGPVNLQQLAPDFYACTGHKLYGPTGIGVLYINPNVFNEMEPFQGGGDMIEHVTWDHTTFAPPPALFEAGTPNITGAIGLAAALEYLAQLGWADIANHEAKLSAYAATLAAARGFVQLLSAPGGPLLTFNLAGCHPSDVAMLLDQQQIAVRSGHHCCMPLLETLGIAGCVRASFGVYTTQTDISRLFTGLDRAHQLLT